MKKRRLDVSKPTTFNNIPAKILTDTKDICPSYLSVIFNNSLSKHYLPSALKMANISPAHIQDEKLLISRMVIKKMKTQRKKIIDL